MYSVHVMNYRTVSDVLRHIINYEAVSDVFDACYVLQGSK